MRRGEVGDNLFRSVNLKMMGWIFYANFFRLNSDFLIKMLDNVIILSMIFLFAYNDLHQRSFVVENNISSFLKK